MTTVTNYNRIFALFSAVLAIILPVPGRVACGIFVLIHFNICVVLASLTLHAVKALKLETMRAGIVAMELVALTVLFKQLLYIYCPAAALSLGFSLYLPAISSVVVLLICYPSVPSLKTDTLRKFIVSLKVSALCLAVFAVRDMLGFGTFTLPAWKHIFVIKLPVLMRRVPLSAFLATVPGCLFLSAVMFFVFIEVMKAAEKKNKEERNA